MGEPCSGEASGSRVPMGTGVSSSTGVVSGAKLTVAVGSVVAVAVAV